VSAAAEESEPPATEPTSAVVRDEIKALLGEEARRKESIERRGVGVITLSAALVTLILTAGQLASRAGLPSLPFWSRTALMVAAASFAIAAILGLVANWVWRYEEIKIADLALYVSRDWWDKPGKLVALRLAEAEIKVLGDARRLTERKGFALQAALFVQTVAIAALASAVALDVWGH
jgi:hypothetical protein